MKVFVLRTIKYLFLSTLALIIDKFINIIIEEDEFTYCIKEVCLLLQDLRIDILNSCLLFVVLLL